LRLSIGGLRLGAGISVIGGCARTLSHNLARFHLSRDPGGSFPCWAEICHQSGREDQRGAVGRAAVDESTGIYVSRQLKPDSYAAYAALSREYLETMPGMASREARCRQTDPMP